MEVVIFSGYNQRAVIAFLRTLKDNCVSYSIIASSNEDPILLTDYKKNVVAVRDSESLKIESFLNLIKSFKSKSKKLLIAPSTERLNRFLLEHKERLEESDCVIPLVNSDLYHKISDKFSFSLLCKENNILVPKEYDINSIDIFPIVAKPKTYFAQSNKKIYAPVFIRNYNELKIFSKTYNKKDFYYQQYILGKSLYLLYYVYKNGQIKKFSQENLIQQPEGKSIIAAISSDFHNSSESKKFENLLKKIKFFGLIMIEIKESGGKFYMIEANPRFWGPSQLFVDAGVNLFEDFMLDNDIIKEKTSAVKVSSTRTKYFWYGGLIATLSRKENLMFYKYDLESFKNSFDDWLFVEIYKRSDTMGIFYKESQDWP